MRTLPPHSIRIAHPRPTHTPHTRCHPHTPAPTPVPPQDPAVFTWEGMSGFGASYSYSRLAVTRQQYNESGGAAGVRQYL